MHSCSSLRIGLQVIHMRKCMYEAQKAAHPLSPRARLQKSQEDVSRIRDSLRGSQARDTLTGDSEEGDQKVDSLGEHTLPAMQVLDTDQLRHLDDIGMGCQQLEMITITTGEYNEVQGHGNTSIRRKNQNDTSQLNQTFTTTPTI